MGSALTSTVTLDRIDAELGDAELLDNPAGRIARPSIELLLVPMILPSMSMLGKPWKGDGATKERGTILAGSGGGQPGINRRGFWAV